MSEFWNEPTSNPLGTSFVSNLSFDTMPPVYGQVGVPCYSSGFGFAVDSEYRGSYGSGYTPPLSSMVIESSYHAPSSYDSGYASSYGSMIVDSSYTRSADYSSGYTSPLSSMVIESSYHAPSSYDSGYTTPYSPIVVDSSEPSSYDRITYQQVPIGNSWSYSVPVLSSPCSYAAY
ncbi:MAG: hypothetical protein KC474_08390 [Cyanobacteria bacterium HKST-UBA04]|nr:hypothetical protein [Cyanobacteria bacterium HKST-UBA04]